MELGVFGGGGVVRDARGSMSPWCRSYRCITDHVIIEALAFRDAIVFTNELGYQGIMCEPDCDEQVRRWEGRSSERYVIAPILSKMDKLCPSFQSFEFRFTGGMANIVLHMNVRGVRVSM